MRLSLTSSTVPSSAADRRVQHLQRVGWEQAHPPGTFTGVPTFLRASLRHARIHPAGYFDPGFEHGRHVRRLDPNGLGADEWLRNIDDVLTPLVENGNTPGVVEWLVTHFPYVLQLVPRRRRERYATGFVEGLLDHE